MTNKRSAPTEITPKKAEELMNLFRKLNGEPSHSHPSEDQFVGYVSGDLGEAEMFQIDQHTEVCESCGAQIEHLATNIMAWSGTSGKHRMTQLRKKVLKGLREQNVYAPSLFEELALQIRSLFLEANLSPGMMQAATEEVQPSEKGDQWSCYLDMDRLGNYTLRISSHDLSLEGVQLRLYSKNWQRDITLIRVDDDQVGAKIVFPRDELANIPKEHRFKIELIQEGPEVE